MTGGLREVAREASRPVRPAALLAAMALGALLAWLAAGTPGVGGPPPGRKIVVYGTSLSAMFPWSAALEEALRGCDWPATVVNSAVGGVDSRWGLENLDQRVIDLAPDIVLLEFSANDAFVDRAISLEESRRNTAALVDRVRAALPRARIILMSMSPMRGEKEHRLRPRLAEYYRLYGEVAKDRGVEFVDLYPKWEALFAWRPDVFARMVVDERHPTPEGNLAVIIPALLPVVMGRACQEGRPPA